MGKNSEMATKAVRAIFGLILLSSSVYAATDVNPATFVFPAPDADGDGYTTDGTREGYDCDDSDDTIWGGSLTHKGCSAGQFRVCGTNGTYGTCKNLSDLATSDLSGLAPGITSLFWVSPSGVTTSGCGTYANPCSILCLSFGNGLACDAWTIEAGHAIIYRGGTYNQSFDYYGITRQLNFRKDGTSSNRILHLAAPESTQAVLTNVGTSGTPSEGFTWFSAPYNTIAGFECTGGYVSKGCLTISFESNNIKFIGNKVHNTQGNAPSNNFAGIYHEDAVPNVELINNRVYDNYDPSNLDSINGSQVNFFRPDYSVVKYNKIYSTDIDKRSSRGLRSKHHNNSTTSVWTNNLIANFRGSCIETGQPSITIENNLLSGCNTNNDAGGAIRFAELGGNAYFTGTSYVRYNTIVNSGFMDYYPSNIYAAIGDDYLTVSHNIIFDNRGTSYPADIADGMVTLGHYIGGALYADMVNSVASFDNNCYETTTDPFFSKGGSSGSTYSSFATWKASSGYDADSFRETLSEDAFYRVTSDNCKNFGWATTSESPSPSPTPEPSIGVTKRLENIQYIRKW